MFGRDIDQSQEMNNNKNNRDVSGDENNQTHKESLFKGPLPPIPPLPHGKSLPISRKAFREIRNFIILMIISESDNQGITGYDLQEKYGFPRGTLLRTLKSFEEKRFVKINEEIIRGRTNKLYTISKLGKDYLNTLKKKWANLFAIMSEKANPERFSHPFAREWFRLMILENIKSLESKLEAEEFLTKIIGGTNEMIKRFSSRINELERFKVKLEELFPYIENMKQFDQNILRDEIKNLFKSLKDEWGGNN